MTRDRARGAEENAPPPDPNAFDEIGDSRRAIDLEDAVRMARGLARPSGRPADLSPPVPAGTYAVHVMFASRFPDTLLPHRALVTIAPDTETVLDVEATIAGHVRLHLPALQETPTGTLDPLVVQVRRADEDAFTPLDRVYWTERGWISGSVRQPTPAPRLPALAPGRITLRVTIGSRTAELPIDVQPAEVSDVRVHVSEAALRLTPHLEQR